jgi:hypothetical protein
VPEIKTAAPSGPEFGVRINVDMTVNPAVAVSPCEPVKVKV